MVMVVVIVIQVLVVRFFGLCLVQLMTARHLRLFSAIGQEFWLLSHTKKLSHAASKRGSYQLQIRRYL